MTQTPNRLYGSREVCEVVGVDRSTLSRWIKDGIASPVMRMPGQTGAYLFDDAEVARLAGWYALNKRRKTTEDAA